MYIFLLVILALMGITLGMGIILINEMITDLKDIKALLEER